MGNRLALLFDLDGTLVVADHLHHRAFAAILAPFGRTLSFEEYRERIMGAANERIMRALFPDLPLERHRALAEEKERIFRESATSLEPAPGAVELLDWAAREGAGVAVVTNAPRANAELMLAGAGIADRIPLLVIADELARGKPDPLPYLTAMERLGGEPIAFEDSRAGIAAARAAGIFTFGMRTGLTAAELLGAGADAVVDDFRAEAVWEKVRGAAP